MTPRFKRSQPSAEATYLLGTVDLGTRLYTPAAVVLLATGIWLVLQTDAYAFSNAFVSLGFLTVILGAILAMAVFGPRGREAAELFEGGDVSRARTVQGRIQAFGMLDLVLFLVTIWAMVARWGA